MKRLLNGLLHSSVAWIVFLPLFAYAQPSAAPSSAQSQQGKTSAQSPHAPAIKRQIPRAEAVTASSDGRIHLDVIVTDEKGMPVRGLTTKDFTVLDNGKPMPVLSFHAYNAVMNQPPPPVSFAIVFDTVNIQFRHIAYIRQQVSSFLRQNGGHLTYPVSLLYLTDTGVKVLAQPSYDGNALAATLDKADSRLRDITLRAGDYGQDDRYQISLELFLAVVHDLERVPGRKMLVWLGPGWPMLTSPEWDQPSAKDQRSLFNLIVSLSARMREDQVAVDSVAYGEPDAHTYFYQNYLKGLRSPYQATADNLALKVLATQSGGLIVFPTNDVTGGIDSCIQDANSYYSISFQPPHARRPNEYHALKLKVDKPKVTVRTNTGYYDDPQTVSAP